MFETPEVLAEQLRAAALSGLDEHGRLALSPDLDPDGSWTERLVALERVKAAAEAEQIMVMSAMVGWAQDWLDKEDAQVRPRSMTLADRISEKAGRPCADELVADQVAPALHLSPMTAAARVDRSARIARRLPGTLAALRRGDLDLGRALAIDQATGVLDDEAAGRVEERVLAGAIDQTAPELRAALRMAVIAIDPKAAEKRRRQAARERSVVRYARDDGMSVIQATLSAIDTGEIYDLIDEVARRTKTSDDTRSMDQRRADAYVQILLGRDPHLGPGDPPFPLPPVPPTGPEDGPPDPAEDDVRPGEDDVRPGEVDVRPAEDDADPRDDVAAREGEPITGEPTTAADPGRPSLADLPGGTAARGPDDRDDPGMAEPEDLHERFPPEADPISELASLALSAMVCRRPSLLPWVAINATTGPDGAVVLVGELQGYGPITAEHARHLLTVGAARVPDDVTTREPTDDQARNHDPPTWLDREIRARDGTCRFPGCRRSAHRVDLDHTVSFPRGLTVRYNLGGLCRRHHRTKTAGAWRLEQELDGHGTMTWTSRLTGLRYTTYPRGVTGEWRGASRG